MEDFVDSIETIMKEVKKELVKDNSFLNKMNAIEDIIKIYHKSYITKTFDSDMMAYDLYKDYIMHSVIKRGVKDFVLIEFDCGLGGYNGEYFLYTGMENMTNFILYKDYEIRNLLINKLKGKQVKFKLITSLHYKHRLPNKELGLISIYKELLDIFDNYVHWLDKEPELFPCFSTNMMLIKDALDSGERVHHIKDCFVTIPNIIYDIDVKNDIEIVNSELDDMYKTFTIEASHYGVNLNNIEKDNKDLLQLELKGEPSEELLKLRYKTYVNDILILNYFINVALEDGNLNSRNKEILRDFLNRLIENETSSLHTINSNRSEDLYFPIYGNDENKGFSFDEIKDELNSLARDYLNTMI